MCHTPWGFYMSILPFIYIYFFQPDILSVCKKYISLLLSAYKPAAVVALIGSIKTYLFFPRGTENAFHCGMSHTYGCFLSEDESASVGCLIPEESRTAEETACVYPLKAHSILEMYTQKSPFNQDQRLL